jgi:hypothetical protein
VSGFHLRELGLPIICVVWPLGRLDTPVGWFWIQENLFSLIAGKASPYRLFGAINKIPVHPKDIPNASGLITRCRKYAQTIRTEDGALHPIVIPI